MKRSLQLFTASAAFGAMLAITTPAFAVSDGSDAAGAAAGIFILVCWGILALLFLALFVLWIVMLIDCIQRQEYEFPNSNGSSKTTWLIVLLVTFVLGFWWIAAIAYYFMVYKKVKRGTLVPPQAGYAPPAPPQGGGYPPPPPPAGGYAPPPPPPPGGYAPPPPQPQAPPAAPPAPPAPPSEPPAPPAPPTEPPA